MLINFLKALFTVSKGPYLLTHFYAYLEKERKHREQHNIKSNKHDTGRHRIGVNPADDRVRLRKSQRTIRAGRAKRKNQPANRTS